ncbi:(R)-mandelonitrile lyase [Salinicola socius]|uniref:TetR family transcriptional regulator n=1 Tax=Salinicola socius TaxID=404433 RepID=A0A1Q8SU55_9GAMM|nr:cupin domain-containing protein [Salinicola socius]OLO04912.1 TetR family transcriptional regulator [Salinicola socius]
MNAKQLLIATGLLLVASVSHAQSLEITHSEDRPTVLGSSTEFFTGESVINPLFDATEHTRATAAEVTFLPKSRSNWHTHPAGQMLVVTSGKGWVQAEGEDKQVMQAGDVIWTPPGVKHWHGATSDKSVSHIAIQEQVDGANVNWMEPVTDEQYDD